MNQGYVGRNVKLERRLCKDWKRIWGDESQERRRACKLNIDRRSRNHSCHGKAVSITYSGSAVASLLRLWVRIPPRARMFVCCECCVLSGRGLCDGLITRPGESYRLCCVVVCDLKTSRMGAPYIYDISRLKVNNLTLILLTWRKWRAPNNASK